MPTSSAIQPDPPGVVRVNRTRLLALLHRRGMSVANLAAEAHVSENTIHNALRGEPVFISTLMCINQALRHKPEIEGMELLLDEGTPAEPC